jgi:exonuclease SbcC
MNTQELKSIIANKFSSIPTTVKENIFRVNAEFKHRTFAKYYFDCTNSFLSESFDLLTYQQDLIADDYYKSNGPLQWNFYLYFITDAETLSQETRRRIESDKNFSRKLITNEIGLIRLFEVQEKLQQDSSKRFDNSLLSVWKEKLRQIGLQGIYLIDTYPRTSEVFNLFLDKKRFDEPEVSTGKVSTQSTLTGFISDLVMDGYRSFKTKKHFKFKKVNLIKGVNGTGKTSLLEAIELCICGQTYENPKKLEPNNALQITYANGSVDQYTPNETKKFQERDRIWFGNIVLRGNALSQNFHVYNFFDSDTAARFAGETKGEAIQQIFSSLVLGEQTNVVFDRITRVYEKTQDEIKKLSKESQLINTEIDSIRKKLNAMDSGSSVVSELGKIIELLQNIRWAGARPLLTSEQHSNQFTVQLNYAVDFFNTITEFQWVINPTLASLSAELIQLETLQRLYNEFSTTFDQLAQDVNTNSTMSKNIQRQIGAIDGAMTYLDEPQIQSIINIEQTLSDTTATIHTTDRIIQLIEMHGDQNNSKINVRAKSLIDRISDLRSQQARTSDSLKSIETRLGQVKSLKSQLAGLGKQYIQLTDDENTCPLCNTHLENKNLSQIIDALQSVQDEAITIAQLATQLTQITDAITVAQDAVADIILLRSLLQKSKLIRDTDPGEDTFLEALDRTQIINQEAKVHLERLKILKQQFSDNNLTAEGFAQHSANLKEANVDIQFGPGAKSNAEEKKRRLGEQRSFIVTQEIALREQIEVKQRAVSQAFASYFRYGGSDESKYQSYLEVVNARVKGIHNTLSRQSEIQMLLPLTPQDNLMDKHEQIKQLNSAVNSYHQSLANNNLRTEYIDRSRTLTATLDRIRLDETLLTTASTALHEIIHVNNKENFLRDFFISNKDNILNIFRSIHLPNEFDDILFDSAESIKLKVTGTKTYRDLTEISTGQKSAFILSLFLTLNNNIKEGPPIMIFDDPVAYVDDINTLSFLDFLRDQVITSDKQIFFATANNKLANLFRQKFSFLDSDFATIELEQSYETTTENV